MALHSELSGNELHTPFRFIYSTESARTGATGLTSIDEQKLALQTSDSTVWVLTNSSGPTWAQVGKYNNASELLTAMKTVDGSGSGLDADMLDGKHASDFALSSAVSTPLKSGYGYLTGITKTLQPSESVTTLSTTITVDPTYNDYAILVCDLYMSGKAQTTGSFDLTMTFYDNTTALVTKTLKAETYTINAIYTFFITAGTHVLKIYYKNNSSQLATYVYTNHLRYKWIG